MKHRRYGPFKLRNHLTRCFFVLVLIGYGMAYLILDISFVYGCVFLLIAAGTVVCYALPFTETFELTDNELIISKGRNKRRVLLPAQFIVIVSYADICTDFAKRVSLLNNTDIIKGKWAISLLNEVDTANVLHRLREEYCTPCTSYALHRARREGFIRYTNCYIEEWFKSGDTQSFIYSFVCDPNLLEQVLKNKNYTMILPESLSDQINTTRLSGNVHIDKES